MTKRQKAEVKNCIIATIAIIYSVAFTLSLLMGLSSANSSFDKDYKKGCYVNAAPIDYFIPSYQLGCWLGKPIQKKSGFVEGCQKASNYLLKGLQTMEPEKGWHNTTSDNSEAVCKSLEKDNE